MRNQSFFGLVVMFTKQSLPFWIESFFWYKSSE